MSCVIGIVNKDGVWIGADSAATTNDGERRPIDTIKVFRNKKYLIGFIGSIRGGQILYPESFNPPKLIHEFPDALRDQCEEKGCMGLLSDDQTQIHKCNYLIGYQGKLYEILVDFQINGMIEYSAIGSGSSFAFGSLYTTGKTKLNPEQRIKMALEVAAEFDMATAPPFIIEKL